MIARIEVWGRWGENVSGKSRITTDDYKLTKDAKNAIVSEIERIAATDGIARNAYVKVFVGGRKYKFVFTSQGLERTKTL